MAFSADDFVWEHTASFLQSFFKAGGKCSGQPIAVALNQGDEARLEIPRGSYVCERGPSPYKYQALVILVTMLKVFEARAVDHTNRQPQL